MHFTMVPLSSGFVRGRYWFRTSDLCRVKPIRLNPLTRRDARLACSARLHQSQNVRRVTAIDRGYWHAEGTRGRTPDHALPREDG